MSTCVSVLTPVADMLAGVALCGLEDDALHLGADRIEHSLKRLAGLVVELDRLGVAAIGSRQRQNAADLLETDERIIDVLRVVRNERVEVLDRTADPRLVGQLDDASLEKRPDVIGGRAQRAAGDLSQLVGADRLIVAAHGVHDVIAGRMGPEGLAALVLGALGDGSVRHGAVLLSQGISLDWMVTLVVYCSSYVRCRVAA